MMAMPFHYRLPIVNSRLSPPTQSAIAFSCRLDGIVVEEQLSIPS